MRLVHNCSYDDRSVAWLDVSPVDLSFFEMGYIITRCLTNCQRFCRAYRQ